MQWNATDAVCNGMQLMRIMKVYIQAAGFSETLLTEFTSPKHFKLSTVKFV